MQLKGLCIVSLSAPHYRLRIFQLLEEELGAHFIFGPGAGNIKQIEQGRLKHDMRLPLAFHGGSKVYSMPGAAKALKEYKVVIDDLDILCLSSWYNMLRARFRRQKVFVWSHGWYGREGFVKKWVKRLYCALAAGMLLYGEYAGRLMIENGFNPRKLHVIHNSLDYDTQLEVRKKLSPSPLYRERFGNDNPVLIFIGRLTESKRLDLIAAAMKQLKDKGKCFNLVIVGDGEIRQTLEETFGCYGLTDNVWFYGPSYDENENGRLLYNSDLCVSPGNIGLTAIHAMTYGCPCISHNDFRYQGPEFEAIIPGRTGDFFERGNVSSIADAIERWSDGSAGRREEIRQNCFDEVDRNWNPHSQMEIIKSVVNECL